MMIDNEQTKVGAAVRESESSSVCESESATVRENESSSVRESESAAVRENESASVRANADAGDESNVGAYDKSSRYADDKSNRNAADKSNRGADDKSNRDAKNTGGYNFFAFISRMKYINRWILMRNTINENIQEHSLQVAIIAHALALINNIYFHGDIDADKAAVLGIFHDSDEIITGDLPTPVKYFNSGIREAYRVVEKSAKETLLDMLPTKLEPQYREILYQNENEYIWKIVKAADTLSAYIKCLEETKAGNSEFCAASKSILKKLESLAMPEVDLFIKEFLDGFKLSLDEFGI